MEGLAEVAALTALKQLTYLQLPNPYRSYSPDVEFFEVSKIVVQSLGVWGLGPQLLNAIMQGMDMSHADVLDL